ncbi:MAG TPA: 30S ribosomal protein S17 [Patescibacteria group bacterium]|jgi:small subunit ribosomal protein S17|nr:30S ribosomal protein S17 [Patescibacteria group bacterium]
MKTFEGKIVSLKMNKTAVVEVVRRTPHPLYKKLLRRSKKYKADTAGLELVLGQKVKIAETKPMSKGKFFKVMEVVK